MKNTKFPRIFFSIGKGKIYDKDFIVDSLSSGCTGIRIILKGYTIEELEKELTQWNSYKSRYPFIQLMLDLPGLKPRLDNKFAGRYLTKDEIVPIVPTGSPFLDQSLPVVFHEKNLSQVKPGDRVYIADATILLQITEVIEDNLFARVVEGGHVSAGRSINIPDSGIIYKALSKTDLFLINELNRRDFQVDYLAISFTSDKADVDKVRLLTKNSLSNTTIISKIETAQGLSNIEKIIEASDAIMIARGDMSIEMPLEEIGVFQNKIIECCNKANKSIIVATGILSSLSEKNRPSISEITDLNFLIDQGITSFLLGDQITISNPGKAALWLNKIFNSKT